MDFSLGNSDDPLIVGKIDSELRDNAFHYARILGQFAADKNPITRREIKLVVVVGESCLTLYTFCAKITPSVSNLSLPLQVHKMGLQSRPKKVG